MDRWRGEIYVSELEYKGTKIREMTDEQLASAFADCQTAVNQANALVGQAMQNQMGAIVLANVMSFETLRRKNTIAIVGRWKG